MKIKVEFKTDAGFDGCSIGIARERELGIVYRHTSPMCRQYYEVINKKLFFLAVIKYGISFIIINGQGNK